MIALEGSLQSRNYEDKQGQKRTAYEVIADHIWFCGEKKPDESATMNDIMDKAAAAGVEIDAGGWDPPW